MNDSTDFIEVPLTRGAKAKVSPQDAERVLAHKWCYIPPYAGRSIKKGATWSTQRLHQFILPVEEGMDVDHINGDKLDCRRENLRSASRSENQLNRKARGKSQYPGVWYDPSRNRWAAGIKVEGRAHKLGRYQTELEAARVYAAASLFHHGRFAKCAFDDVTAMSVEAIKENLKPKRKRTFAGIYFKDNGWEANAFPDGKTFYIGRFSSEIEALEAQRAFLASEVKNENED